MTGNGAFPHAPRGDGVVYRPPAGADDAPVYVEPHHMGSAMTTTNGPAAGNSRPAAPKLSGTELFGLTLAQRQAAAKLVAAVCEALRTARNDQRVLMSTVGDAVLVLRGLADDLGAMCADPDADQMQAEARAVAERLLARRLEGVANR